MARNSTVVTVFIASPSDVPKARDAVEQVIHEWNASNSKARGITLLPWRWETGAVAEYGEHPQKIVNRQGLNDADIVIAIFGSRLGQNTPDAVSGTVEEITLANAAKLPVHVYFSTAPLPNDIDLKQLEALRDFQTEIQHISLYDGYESVDELKTKVLRAINHDINGIEPLQGMLPRAHKTNSDDFSVAIEGSIIKVSGNDFPVLNSFIERTKNQLLDRLPRTETTEADTPKCGVLDKYNRSTDSLASLLSSSPFAYGINTKPEDRTPEQYCTEINDWVLKFRERWPSARVLFLGSTLSPCRPVIENNSDTFLEDVELTIHIGEGVVGIDHRMKRNPDSKYLKLPSPPRRWGPRKVDPFSAPQLFAVPEVDIQPFRPRSLSWSNSNNGSVSLKYHVGDLRPRQLQKCNDSDVVLIYVGNEDVGATVAASWSLTARGHHKLYEGKIEVPIHTRRDLNSKLGLALDTLKIE